MDKEPVDLIKVDWPKDWRDENEGVRGSIVLPQQMNRCFSRYKIISISSTMTEIVKYRAFIGITLI